MFLRTNKKGAASILFGKKWTGAGLSNKVIMKEKRQSEAQTFSFPVLSWGDVERESTNRALFRFLLWQGWGGGGGPYMCLSGRTEEIFDPLCCSCCPLGAGLIQGSWVSLVSYLAWVSGDFHCPRLPKLLRLFSPAPWSLTSCPSLCLPNVPLHTEKRWCSCSQIKINMIFNVVRKPSQMHGSS